MSDRVFIVTGATCAVGMACAQRLLEDGHHVVLADLDTGGKKQAAKGLVADTDRAIFVECDVADPLHVHNLIAETLAVYGRIDGLVNLATQALASGSLELSLEDFDRNLATNLRGAFLVSQAVAKHMVQEIEDRADRSRLNERPYAIVNMSLMNDVSAASNYLAYRVAQGGGLQMTKAMALEFSPFGIRVNAIGFGPIKSDPLQTKSGAAGAVGSLDPEQIETILARTPLGRLGLPEEIASIAAFLLSEDASYITGQCIYADGGRLALN